MRRCDSRFRVFLTSILICTGGNASAQASEWVSNGPFGGLTIELVASPSDPERLFAAGSRGLFGSSDGGATWHALAGLGDRYIRALAVDTGDPASVFVVTGSDGIFSIFKSPDGGLSWSPTNTGLPEEFDGKDLVVDPSSSLTLWVGGDSFGAVSVFRSIDGGATWTSAGGGLPGSVSHLAITAADPSLVLAGEGSSVFKTTDGGASWTPLEPVPGVSAMRDLVIDPTDSSVIFVARFEGIFKSVNGGTDWKLVGNLQAVQALAIRPDQSSTIFAATESDGVFKSVDGGASWQPFNDGLAGLGAHVLALAGDDLYLGGDHGVFEAPAKATSWAARNQGLHNSTVKVITLDPMSAAIVYAVTPISVFISVDAGLSWQRTSLSSPSSLTAFALDPVNSQTLYAGTFVDRLFRSSDGGATWSPSGDGLPESLLGAILVDPADPAVVYVGHLPVITGAPGPPPIEGVFKSQDAGASWIHASTGMSGSLAIRDLAFDPTDSSTIYAADRFSQKVWKSTDGAATWFESGSFSSSFLSTLVVDPESPSTLYVAASVSIAPSIFKSLDGGQSWFPIHGDLPSESIADLVLDRDDPRILWAATGDGLFRNLDSGPSWEPFNEGRLHNDLEAVAYRASTQALYVGTVGGGVYQRSFPIFIDGFESGDTTNWSASVSR